MNADRRVVACNVYDVSYAQDGARSYLIAPAAGAAIPGEDRVELLVRSYSGRMVRHWEPTFKLTNFRTITLPPEHPLYGDDQLWDYESEAQAESLSKRAEAERQRRRERGLPLSQLPDS